MVYSKGGKRHFWTPLWTPWCLPVETLIDKYFRNVESCVLNINRMSPHLTSLQLHFHEHSVEFLQKVTNLPHIQNNLEKLLLSFDEHEDDSFSSPQLQLLSLAKFEKLRAEM